MSYLSLKLEKFIYESRFLTLFGIFAILSLVKVGVWYFPNLISYPLLVKNPFSNPFLDPNYDYLISNWLGIFLAWLMKIENFRGIFLFFLLFSVLFVSIVIRFIIQNLQTKDARTSILIFVILPVSATSFFWVGYDSLTLFLFGVSLTIQQRHILGLLIGSLIGLQSFEQGVISFAVLYFALLLSKKQKVNLDVSANYILSVLLGTMIGKLILAFILAYNDLTIRNDRYDFIQNHLEIFLKVFYFNSQLIIWGALGLGWVIFVKFTDIGRKCLPFFIGLSLLLLLLPFIGDQTRVFSILSFPLIFVYWLRNPEFLSTLSKKEVSLLFVFWILIPWQWIWGGIQIHSLFPYDVTYLLNRIFDWFTIPTEPASWPFPLN